MRLSSLIPQLYSRSPRQVLSSSWSERHTILEDDVNLYCWERRLPSEVELFLNRKIDETPDKLSIIIDQRNLVDQIDEARKAWGKTNSSGEVLFWQDVVRIMADFLHFSDRGTARFYLKVVENDACTKFHVDGYNLRLFTTYLGPGTMWLPEKAVNRRALGQSNESIVKDATETMQMAPGHVGILKGEIANGKSRVRGIVHRSPEIEQAGEKRIILRVDV